MAAGNPRRTNPPYLLPDLDQIPDPLSDLTRQYLPAGETVEGVFVIPPKMQAHGFRWRMDPLQALIFSQKGVLHVFETEKGEKEGSGTWVLAEDILKVRLSLILLYGKLEIWGAHSNQVSTITVEYNTVSHHVLSPLLKALLRKTWVENPTSNMPVQPDPTFPGFVKTSFSFYNGLKGEAIQPGESVLGHVYQPELREPVLKVFQRKVFPQTVLAVTNHQLILLQQDLKSKTHHEWIFTFVPVYRISQFSTEGIRDWQKITFYLAPEFADQNIEILFEAQNSQKFLTIWNAINSSS